MGEPSSPRPIRQGTFWPSRRSGAGSIPQKSDCESRVIDSVWCYRQALMPRRFRENSFFNRVLGTDQGWSGGLYKGPGGRMRPAWARNVSVEFERSMGNGIADETG